MVKYIGAAIGKCAEILGCEQAPEVIRNALPQLQSAWHTTVSYDSDKRRQQAIEPLTEFSEKLATATREVIESGDHFITFGGDHSCAIGTWSGVAEAVGEFGLIWIDAHMDAHTPETTLSGNIHGMPVAVLLGEGAQPLTTVAGPSPKLEPANIALLGIRSYETEEAELLDRLGVRVYGMDEINERGFAVCFAEVVEQFQQRELPIGVSFDLDGLDPHIVASVGTPEASGLQLADVVDALATLDPEQLIGVEITEYNPTLDNEEHVDVRVIEHILEKLPLKN